MCGIAGIAGEDNFAPIVAMTRALAHRGPDGEGFDSAAGIALGHRRLSVIDAENGQQPMTTPDGRYSIVFNGEIYNFRELRVELESRGTRFRTRSDTEVLLEAYAAWGSAVLPKLRGMFAFGVWDAAARRLFLARDRLGLKPLYFCERGSSFLFGSEMKALLAHPGVERVLDTFALDDFLTYLYVPAPKTIFRGIRELPPGYWLEWCDGRLRMSRYWDVSFIPEKRSERACVEELLDHLSDAVRAHLESDVPLGVFLSGGLDSSVIAALMARFVDEPVQAFTLGFREGDKRYNEWKYARTVSEVVRAQAREICIPAEATALLSAATRHFDEPFGNPTSLLIYQLSEFVRWHVKVALGGDGGDEVFLGYPRYCGMQLARQYRKAPRSLREIAAAASAHLSEPGNGSHLSRRLREFAQGNAQSLEQMYFNWVSYFSPDLRRRLYTEDFSRATSGYDSSEFLMNLFRRCDAADSIDRASYVDLHSFLPFNILRYADRMSMAHGIELRLPLIDHRLIECMARIPRRYKLHGFRTKALLRRAAQTLLPQKILTRPKLGLNPPMGLWLRGPRKHLLDEYLSPTIVRQRGYFRPEAVQELIDNHLAGHRDYSLHLWALISFEEWHRQYLN